jgi:hypothetical protein
MSRHNRKKRGSRPAGGQGYRGWVYVIDNEGVLNRIKIGFTLDDPVNRALALQETGYAFPHVVQYHALVDNPRGIEWRVHQRLDAWRRSGEWFEITVSKAIAVIREVATSILFEDETPRWHPKHPAPSEFARTRLQRERDLEGRASSEPNENPKSPGEDIVRRVRITAGMARNGGTLPLRIEGLGEVAVRCPAGISSQAKLRLKGCGELSTNGGPRGDLILVVDID